MTARLEAPLSRNSSRPSLQRSAHVVYPPSSNREVVVVLGVNTEDDFPFVRCPKQRRFEDRVFQTNDTNPDLRVVITRLYKRVCVTIKARPCESRI